MTEPTGLEILQALTGQPFEKLYELHNRTVISKLTVAYYPQSQGKWLIGCDYWDGLYYLELLKGAGISLSVVRPPLKDHCRKEWIVKMERGGAPYTNTPENIQELDVLAQRWAEDND